MKIPSRLLGPAAEGALAGALAGGVLGGWEIGLGRDLAHGMLRLAAERVSQGIFAGAMTGVGLSVLLAFLLGVLARLGAWTLRAGVLALALLGATAMILAAFPYRQLLFPHYVYSPHSVSILVFTLAAASLAAILILRARAALRPESARGRSIISVLGAGSLLLGGVSWYALPRLPISAAGDASPVILVSLDTLRADRIGVLGCVRPLTPHLDALAREGTLFRKASTPAPWTLPAHASVFVGRLPFDHGARWDTRAVHPGLATLAERFKDAGFRTAAFTGGGYVASRFGFDQGFEIYENHDEVLEGGAEKITAAALDWVRSHRREPFFLFLHSLEVHTPYRRSDLTNPSDAGRLPPILTFKEVEAIHRGVLVPTPAEKRYINDLYDGGVARADRVIGGFLATLRREGVLDRAILMVISDHGEDLWDHVAIRSPGHGHSLYEELLHVPWLVRAPGRVKSGREIDVPVSLIDLAPTLLDLAGLPPDPEHRGRDLAPALRDGSEPTPAPVWAESPEYGPDRFSLREGDLKVVVTPFPNSANAGVSLPVKPVEVFDLAADPKERVDLSGRLSDPARRMMVELWDRCRRFLATLGEKKGKAEIPKELERQLRSLGYVQ